MFWRDKSSDEFINTDKASLYQVRLFGCELIIGNITIDIPINGVYSVKKRKLISPYEQKDVYKITIDDLTNEIIYVGLAETATHLFVYPIIKSSGVLFGRINKKILADRKKNRIEFSVDSTGKFIS
jgi:hypothetical protein